MSELTNGDVPRKVHALAGRRMPFEKFFFGIPSYILRNVDG